VKVSNCPKKQSIQLRDDLKFKTSASWLNLVECWFRKITEKWIRRGVFKSDPDLISAIMEYLDDSNAAPKPFIWTASVQNILSKVKRANGVLETLH